MKRYRLYHFNCVLRNGLRSNFRLPFMILEPFCDKGDDAVIGFIAEAVGLNREEIQESSLLKDIMLDVKMEVL